MSLNETVDLYINDANSPMPDDLENDLFDNLTYNQDGSVKVQHRSDRRLNKEKGWKVYDVYSVQVPKSS